MVIHRNQFVTRSIESLSTSELLLLVGQRVKLHRMQMRMSRKRLAEKSGVSERYLAQLEAGQGNMSIALLHKVTRAIGMQLHVLMADDETGLLADGMAADGMAEFS